jgi:hypothetical protein
MGDRHYDNDGLEWQEHHDPFWGQCILIHGLSYDREKKDYVALLLGADDPKYDYSRRFLKHRGGLLTIPCDPAIQPRSFCGVPLDGAVLEIRVNGHKYLRLISAGRLEPLDPANVRPALAAWLFATGQSLHP